MCAGHKQIDVVVDEEDRPFARLAIAVAPSLLLSRDRHLGMPVWARQSGRMP